MGLLLGPALGQRGYTIIYGSREPARDSVRALVAPSGGKAVATNQREAAAQAGIVVLAVTGDLLDEVTAKLGEFNGMIVAPRGAAGTAGCSRLV